tara:strand:+ start:101 stop:352 length:252 start_codon:yes stop_codon:yes gene_type:complete
MSKQLILITAPFNCGYCKTAQKELPSLCESKGWELIEMENEQDDDSLPVNTYPTIMFRVDNKMVDTMTGYGGKEKIEEKLNSY